MKSVFSHIISAVALFLSTLNLQAKYHDCEEINDYVLSIDTAIVEVVGDNTVLSLKLTAKQDVPARQSVILIPVITDTLSSHKTIFPAIYINSRNQQIVQERELKKNDKEAMCYRKKKGEDLHINYLWTIPYERWMDSAVLTLSKLSCGCNVLNERGQERLCAVKKPSEPYIALYPVFQVPQPETVKNREDKGTANLCFKLDKTDIEPNYMNNAEELAKINNLIEYFKSDKNVVIKNMSITGHASPEGPLDHNISLSEGRMQSVRQYILKKCRLNNINVKASSAGENWEGFTSYLSSHPETPECTTLQHIIQMTTDLDERESLMKNNAKTGFNFCLTSVFPSLRLTDYTVEYVVRAFSLEESEDIFEEHPNYLNLNEIYRLAEKYKDDEEKYYSIMKKAYLMYENDHYTNLTMSYLAIRNRFADEALGFLEKVNPCEEKTYNMALVKYLRGDLNGAIHDLEQIDREVIPEVESQLKEFHLLKNYQDNNK